MARVAAGEEVVVTLRGKAYVRLLPIVAAVARDSYPLRGSVLRMADDFDAPLTDLWGALAAPADPARRPSRR